MLITSIVGAWRSLDARLLWEQEVGGSTPLAPTNNINNLHNADFAKNRRFCVLSTKYLPHFRISVHSVRQAIVGFGGVQTYGGGNIDLSWKCPNGPSPP